MSSKNIIKIAVMAGEKFNGGVWGILYNYFRRIDHDRFKITFFVAEKCPEELSKEIRRLGGDFVTIPPRGRVVRYLMSLVKIYRKERFDIVHANLTTLNFMPLFAAWVAGVPVRISHSHSNSNPADRGLNILKNALRLLSHLFVTDYFTCSEKSGRWLFGNKFYDSGRVQLIRNAIDVSRFAYDEQKRRAIRGKYGLQGRFVVGNIGRFTAQKNHPFILAVFAQMVRVNPDARLLYVGWGEQESKVRGMVSNMKLEPYVVFAGEIADTAAYYSAMDVFLLPSIFEGLCVCLIEAQANGLPCVVSTNNSIESKITPLLMFRSLEDPPMVWARDCLSARRSLDSGAIQGLVVNAGYEIAKAVKGLEDAYRAVLVNGNREEKQS